MKITLRWMAKVALVLAVALPASAQSGKWDTKQARVATTVLFIAAETFETLDLLQTFSIAKSQCPRGPGTCGTARSELNPLLGQHPSQGVVLGYFTTIILTQTALYVWGPNWLSATASGLTLAIEAPLVVHNFKAGAYLTLPF